MYYNQQDIMNVKNALVKYVHDQTFSSPTNAYVEFIKTKLKLGRLLQHVSVYKETIIREPVSA